MIKQIQLRGISRTPSDRATEDGGLAESLNVYLDSDESAPALIPDDVTADLGLPTDLEAEKIFIHKTANYENYIVVQSDKVVAFTPDIEDEEPLKVLDLAEGEEVNDIVSVGNTIILSSGEKMYYFLFINRAYSFLGNKVTFPYVHFEAINKRDEAAITASAITSTEEPGTNWFGLDDDYLPTQEEWNNDSSGDEHENTSIRNCLTALWDSLQVKRNSLAKENRLMSAIFIRYDIELLDGSISSMPILLPYVGHPMSANITRTKRAYWLMGQFAQASKEDISLEGYYSYQILAKVSDLTDLSNWSDLISSIRIYVSPALNWDLLKYKSQMMYRNIIESDPEPPSGVGNLKQYDTKASISFLANPDFLDHLLAQSSTTFLVKEIKVFQERSKEYTPDFHNLQKGMVLDISKYFDSADKDHLLENQDMLTGDDMKHYPIVANKIAVYNKSLLLIQPSQTVVYDYNRLNAYDVTPLKSSSAPKEYTISYDVTYVLKGTTHDIVVKAGPFDATRTVSKYQKYFSFQIFPDNRAYKMIVKATRSTYASMSEVIKYGEFEMKPHPYIDCAYYYGGMDVNLWDACDLDYADIPLIRSMDDTDNKLMQSEIADPFTFPLSRRHTFQSKVLGVAVATRALSQGQFGQFPLYVFTEDGIWAMETGADGSFVSQKPLSREVCVNPDSITSLDNAVVFVTAQGVMLLQGSQVTNLSPNMNGKHYILDDNTEGKLANTKWSDLTLAMKDPDPFMSFMKDARCAYDYEGNRLIFLSPSNQGFQYVYKLDTRTWHKLSMGLNLIQPLNSYPECLVMGKGSDVERTFLKITDISQSQLSAEQLIEDIVSTYGEGYNLTYEEVFLVFIMEKDLDITDWSVFHQTSIKNYFRQERVDYEIISKNHTTTKVFYLSTILDVANPQNPAKGCIITRPIDLGEVDIKKTIKDIRIRGQYEKGHVSFILQGSDDGFNWSILNSLRGKSWKLFRMIILTDLQPHERISWIDIEYETRFKNRMR